MAKKARREQPTQMTKKQRAKSRKVRRRERATLIGIVSVSVLVLGVLVYGAVQEFVVKPNAPIATVDGIGIPVRLYQKLWTYSQANASAQLQQYQAALDQVNAVEEPTDSDTFMAQYYGQVVQQLRDELMNLDYTVLDNLIDDELVRIEARKEGITVTPQEVQTSIDEAFGYDPNPPEPTPTAEATEPITGTPVPTPTRMTVEQFHSAYQSQVDFMREDFGITEEEFRSLFEMDLLRSKLQAVLAERVPTTAEQVHARHILVATEEEAEQVLERLNAGEDFAALAQELSTDESNKEEGGDLGWFARGVMVPEFEEVAFSLEPGEISDPVQTEFGYHIIQVLEKDPNHPLDEATLNSLKETALEDWLATQRYSDRVKRYFSSDLVPKAYTPQPLT